MTGPAATWLDQLAEEQYHHHRLPPADNSNGPTALYLEAMRELDSRVHTLPTADSAAVEKPRRRRRAS